MLIPKLNANGKFIFLSVAVLLCSFFSFAQQKLTYTIINNRNDTIGHMQITQKVSGDNVYFTVASFVQTKVLITIKVNIQEESYYHKEKLMSSSSKRFVNDKKKGDKLTKANADAYLITDDGKEKKLNQKMISYNFAKLYFTEPVSVKEIYSDYYQENLVIQSLNNHVYKINKPDGGFNTYYYTNGVCNKVVITGSLFNAQMIVNK